VQHVTTAGKGCNKETITLEHVPVAVPTLLSWKWRGKLAAFSALEGAEINPSLTIWPSYRVEG